MAKTIKHEKTNKKIVNFEDIKTKSQLDYILVTITIILTLIGIIIVIIFLIKKCWEQLED